jgi:WD repeat-containing protein 68
MDKYCNVVRIVKKRYRSVDVPRRSNYADIQTVCEFSHPYPATKIKWSPDTSQCVNPRELIATSGDYLRIWDVQDDGSGRGTCIAKRISLFNNVSLHVFRVI